MNEDEELYDLYSLTKYYSGDQEESRNNRWTRHVARMGDRRGAYRVLADRLDGKRPLGRPGHRWEAAIKIDLQEVKKRRKIV